ncbi:MAG: hypothetical protein U0547_01280 [Dehalococcoidia bacterium]
MFDDFIAVANARMTEHAAASSRPHVEAGSTMLGRLWGRIWHEDQEKVLEDSWRLADTARRYSH